MGSFMSKTMGKVMDENMKKQQDFMLENQKTVMERQMTLQVEMRRRMMAQQLSMVRERFYWWAGFFSLATIGLTAGYIKSRQPAVIAPLVPLSFLFGYQADMALGNKMERILVDTENILRDEQNLLRLPGEPLSIQFIERERKNMNRQK